MKLTTKTIFQFLILLLFTTVGLSQTLTVTSVDLNSTNQYTIPVTLDQASFTGFELVFSIKNSVAKIEDINLNSKLDKASLKFTKRKDKNEYTLQYAGNNQVTLNKNEKLFDFVVGNNKSYYQSKIFDIKKATLINRNSKTDINTDVKASSAYLKAPFITKDEVLFGLLMLTLGFIFFTESKKGGFWSKFYKIVPGLFLAYMLPAILTTSGLIAYEWDTITDSGEIIRQKTNLYYIASRYLLPAALVLMTLSIDLKAVFNLGWKALIMFFTGTIGIVIGGPIAILIIAYFSPETVGGVGPDAVWKGLSTLAGSWIGGGANQTAMLEIYGYNQSEYGKMVFVDIVVANLWMAILLIGIGKRARINKWLKADTSSIEILKEKVSSFSESVKRNPSVTDLILLTAIAFGSVSIAHFGANYLAPFFGEVVSGIESQTLKNTFTFLDSTFFWMISIATIIAIILSFTKAKNYEGAGASKYGSVFIYILVVSIGMKINITSIFDNVGLIAIGLIWMAIHAILLIIVAKLIKAPYFFLAVGSQANVGGAASAPIVAAAFHPSLATVGVLLAVFGYAVGTLAAIGCTILMQLASGG